MTIINMANAMYSEQELPQQDNDDRLDAAKALLGVSPNSVVDNNGTLTLFASRDSFRATSSAEDLPSVAQGSEGSDSITRRSRSDSAGLEALAFLATKEQSSIDSTCNPSTAAVWEDSSSELEAQAPLVASAVSSSSSSDEETMPPPPPRRSTTRRRSVSNPEGMEKWAPREQGRLRFVLPTSILEEELAEASAAMKAKQLEQGEEGQEEDQKLFTERVEEDEENLEQAELLKRARSRLLEDLSEVNMNGEKGIQVLPHTLKKYKEVYNQNGRIGIYTPAERSAIISRFLDKRTRRVWNKKIRYNCRKSLADRRMRVKGRFVKRSTEQQAKIAAASGKPAVPSTIPEEERFVSPESSEVEETADVNDAEMPDISDPDAGFCPTDEQPFRRLRRHTIT